MEFTCARPNCGKSFIKLGGWKKHMSRVHGGYDDADIAEVTTGGGSSTEADVRQRMEAFAASLDGGGEGERKENGGKFSSLPDDVSQAPPAPAPSSIKTVKASPKKLKKILASIPQVILENTGITMDEEDKDALEEAGEFLSDIFGVEFEVPQEKRVLHSRFWAIIWVAGVAGIIYFKHKFADVWAKMYDTYKKRLEEAAEKS